ncbi:MAG: DEAD/DEAH box helicase, partial [Candidatus Sericytochromatia bacterium]
MPENLLKKYWGYDSFRGSQKEIVANIIDGKDVLAILPTGGGKSICYQIPALLSEGTTIVISPLIALMQDQVDNLKKLNIPSSFLNSSLLPQEKNSILNNLSLNKYKLLYLAPESLNSNKLMSILKR